MINKPSKDNHTHVISNSSLFLFPDVVSYCFLMWLVAIGCWYLVMGQPPGKLATSKQTPLRLLLPNTASMSHFLTYDT